MTTGEGRTEEYKVSGESLLAKVKELVHEGNIRRSTTRRASPEAFTISINLLNATKCIYYVHNCETPIIAPRYRS